MIERHWADTGLFHIIAHRGASAYAPDNSLEAFEVAKQHGATDIEVDVHGTADGEFVVRHDAAVGDGSKYISELTLSEYVNLCEARAETAVQLLDVLTVAKDQDLGLYLDLKQVLPWHMDKLITVIYAHDVVDRVVIASFRTDIAKTIKRRAPAISTSVLFHDPNMDLHSLVKGVNCDFLHPCFDIFADPLARFTPEWAGRAKATGAGMIVWNLTDSETATAVLNIGASGACADDPQILRTALMSTTPHHTTTIKTIEPNQMQTDCGH